MSYLFGFQGRIGRLEWWLGQLISFIASICFIFAFASIAQHSNYNWNNFLFLENGSLNYNTIITLLLVYLLSAWSSIALSVKRFHDRNKSGLWYLIILVPFIGVIWQLIELGFLPGTDGSNDYDDPKDTTSSWSSDKYNTQDQSNNNIDEIIARHVAEHKYRSPNFSDSIKKPMGNNKPAFGKRT